LKRLVERGVHEGARGCRFGAADHAEGEAAAVPGAREHLADVGGPASHAQLAQRKTIEGVHLRQQWAEGRERPHVADVHGADTGLGQQRPVGGHMLGGAMELAE